MKNIKKMNKTTKSNLLTYLMVIAIYAVVQILVATGNVSSLLQGLLVPLCAYIILAVSLNLTVGILGELSLGHAGFMCVGAFTSAFFSKCMVDVIPSSGIRFFLALLIGAATAGICGILIGIPVLRLKGDYLAIVTLAFGEIIKNIANILFIGKDSNGLHFSTKDSISLGLEEGGKVIQETRTWDEKEGVTKSMRTKEEANDYRYFPEPDLVPFTVSDEYIEEIRKSLPELPDARKARYMKDFGISDADAVFMTNDKATADYFEACVACGAEPKAAVNWLMGEFASQLSTDGIEISAAPVKAEDLAGLLTLISKGTISGKIAKKVFATMWKEGGKAEDIVKAQGLVQISDTGALQELVDKVVSENPKAVEDFKAGKKKAVGALVGQIMKATKGKANPKVINELLNKKLASL